MGILFPADLVDIRAALPALDHPIELALQALATIGAKLAYAGNGDAQRNRLRLIKQGKIAQRRNCRFQVALAKIDGQGTLVEDAQIPTIDFHLLKQSPQHPKLISYIRICQKESRRFLLIAVNAKPWLELLQAGADFLHTFRFDRSAHDAKPKVLNHGKLDFQLVLAKTLRWQRQVGISYDHVPSVQLRLKSINTFRIQPAP